MKKKRVSRMKKNREIQKLAILALLVFLHLVTQFLTNSYSEE